MKCTCPGVRGLGECIPAPVEVSSESSLPPANGFPYTDGQTDRHTHTHTDPYQQPQLSIITPLTPQPGSTILQGEPKGATAFTGPSSNE